MTGSDDDVGRRSVLRGMGTVIGISGLAGCLGTKKGFESNTFTHRAGSASSSATASGAYRLLRNESHWHSTPVEFVVGTNTFPDGLSTESVKGAIEAAFTAWNGVPNTVDVFAAPTYDSDLQGITKRNGVNELVWSSFGNGEIGLVHTRGESGTDRLLEVDVELNSDLSWTTTPDESGSAFDVQNVLTHELGHNGLRDVLGAPEQTMYHTTDRGETKKRTLESGDVAGWQRLYGTNS